MLTTTKGRSAIIMMLVCAYLALPLVYDEWLNEALVHDDLPVYADSIGAPFTGVLLVWFAGLPFLSAFCIGFEFLCRKTFDTASDRRRER